jgi:arabinogalactan oligomer/maltooligosaccharide transport system permease protein
MKVWSGRKKTLTIFLFLLPTIIAILIFNIYPILLNTYVSFTNRNKFRPNPDCSVVLTNILDPLCWPSFRENAPKGLGSPYKLADPVYDNYAKLLGTLFTTDSLLALLRLFIAFIPIIIAWQVDKWLGRRMTRDVGSGTVWILGLIAAVVVAVIADSAGAFSFLMKTGDFIVVVFRTVLFVVIRVPLTFLIGFVLAMILNSTSLPGKTFFRVILFLPWGASSVAILVSLIWQFLFREQGTINQVLALLFNIEPKVWLNDPVSAFGVVVLADIWFSYPFFMVAILGALQSIPTELYEAAEVDGATWWHKTASITLPLIRPAVLPATVLTSITAFQMFGTAFAITAGGPQTGANTPGATEFVMLYAYRQIFQTQNYGLATAFAVLIFLMLFGATLYSLRLTRITKGAYE